MGQSSSNAPNIASNGIVVVPQEGQIYAEVGAWLLSILPNGCQVVQGQANRVAAPVGLFAAMTIIGRERLATNDSCFVTSGTIVSRVVTEPTRVAMQVGIFGDGAGDAVHRMIALWRDPDAGDFLAANGAAACPLYASEARQMGFLSAEKQYEDRWSADLHMQVNYQMTIPSETATSGKSAVVEADASAQ